MKNNFRGWRDVYSFTFAQITKRKGYRLSTILISVLLITGILLAVLIPASIKNEGGSGDIKGDLSASLIQEVYIQDESGFFEEFAQYAKILPGEIYGNTQFINVESFGAGSQTVQMQAADAGGGAAAVLASYDAEDPSLLRLTAYMPENAVYGQSDADRLLSHLSAYFNMQTVRSLTPPQLVAVYAPVAADFGTIGESSNVMAEIIRMLAPMLFGVILYTMLLLYGQDIAKLIASEKISKLAENLLVSVHPNALITGKVLANAVTAFLQFFIWVFSAVGTLLIADAIAASRYPAYQNAVTFLIRFFRDHFSETALSLPSILLALLIFCMGFVFYCFLAGMSGCLISKMEESAGASGLFQLIVVSSWMFSYFMPLLEKDAIMEVLRYVPLTAPFIVPVDLITGTIGLGQGLLVTLLIAVFTLFVIRISVKVYKGLILYTGQTVSLKLIRKIMKVK